MFDVTYNNYNNYGNHVGFGHVDNSGKTKETEGTRGAEGPKETSGNGNAVTFSEMRQNLKVAMQIPEIKSGYNFTQQEREVKYTSLAEKLQHARGATAGGKSILFDMYALMALIQEVSQKMRDAMREMRKAENTTMYANIKAQAAIQREAAVCAMITGAVMCGVQGAIMIGATGWQIRGMVKQAGLGKLSGETMANEQATMTAKGHDPVAAQNQLDTLKNKLPESVTGNRALNENTVRTDAKVDAAHNQLEVSQMQEKIDTAQTKLDTATNEFKQNEVVKPAQDKLDAAKLKYDNAQKAVDTAQADFDTAKQKMDAAQNTFNEVNRDPNATPQEKITASKNLLDAKREFNAAKDKLDTVQYQRNTAKGELDTAKNQLKEVGGELSNFEKNSADYVNALKKQGTAQQNLTKAKNALTKSQNELNNINRETSPEAYRDAEEVVRQDKLGLELAKGEFNEAEQTMAKFDTGKAQARLDAANEKLTNAQELKPANQQAVKDAEQEVAAAKMDLAKAKVFEAQTEVGSLKSMLESRGLRGANPKMSVNDAQKNYNSVVGAGEDAKGFNTEAENMTKHNAGLRDVANNQKVYDSLRNELVDMKEQLEIGTKTNEKGEVVSLTKEEVAKLKADIEVGEQNLGKAENNLRYARALQVKHSADLKLSPGEYANVHRGCEESAAVSAKNLGSKHIANDPQRTIQRAMLTQQLGQILGNFSQQVVQGIKEIMTSKATELQADQKLTEDQLDQIKDLMSQYLTMIQKVIDLFSSVIQKESQTIEEILRA